jgi:hypothetical protein
MNKHQFIAELATLLKVKPADKQSILEEYESYIAEALASGEREEDIIASLESPAQIAEHANVELGMDPKERFHEEPKSSYQSKRSSKQRSFLEGFDDELDKLDDELDKVFKASEKAIKRASETINQSIKGINFGSILDKVMDGVDKVVDGVMDIDIKGTASMVAMRFDNSKVESYALGSTEVIVHIHDENSDLMSVEVVQGQSQWMVKYLPTSLKCDVQLNGDQLTIRVPKTTIKFAEKKRLRLYIPELLQHITLHSNCPLIVKDVSTNMEVTLQDVVGTFKQLTMDELSISTGDAALSIKGATLKVLSIKASDGPVSIKDIDARSIQLHVEDGPVLLSGLHGDSVWLEAGDGPKVVRHSTIKELIFQSAGGPTTMKELHLDVLKGHAEGHSIHVRDCVIKDNQLGELG